MATSVEFAVVGRQADADDDDDVVAATAVKG
jgi:hypothetical protein